MRKAAAPSDRPRRAPPRAVTPVPAQRGLPLIACAMDTDVHHVALMRKAELVVRYEAGPPLPGDHFGYAGVFKCDDDVDEIFRRSEPPTHDDWEAAIPAQGGPALSQRGPEAGARCHGGVRLAGGRTGG